MKKLCFLLSCIAISASWFSCSEERGSIKPKHDTNKVNLQLLDEVKKLPSVEAQRIAFREVLNADEKYYLFYEKLTFYRENFGYNKNQIKLIDELIENFSPTVYTDQPDAKRFQAFFAEDWLSRATETFKEENLIPLVGYLSIPAQLHKSNARIGVNEWELPELDGGGLGEASNNDERNAGCGCSLSVDFCVGRETCRGSNICLVSAHGCGLLWVNTCNGNCRL